MAGYQFATMQDVKRIARAVIRSERSLRGSESYGLAGSKNQIWFPFRNEYAGSIPAYSVVEITDCVAVPGLELSYFKATRPSTTFRGPGWYAVTSSQTVLEGETGQLRFEGTSRVAYDTGTPAKFEKWGVKPGQFTLSKGYPGFASVHRVESTDRKLLLGTLGEIGTLLCKATAQIAVGTFSSSYTIQQGTPGSESTAGFTTLPTMYTRGTLVINEFFYSTFRNGTWYVELEDNRWLGKADSAINAAASGTVSLWTGTPGSETDSTSNATSVYNRTSVNTPSGGWVVVSRVNGKLYLEPWSC